MKLDSNSERRGLYGPWTVLLILAVASSVPLQGQAQTQVTGTVRDASTQRGLEDVRIEVVDRRIRSVTDSTGFCALRRATRHPAR